MVTFTPVLHEWPKGQTLLSFAKQATPERVPIQSVPEGGQSV